MVGRRTLLAAGLLAWPLAGRGAEAIRIVAAENFYADVAGQIGGAAVEVTGILSNPDQDPHLFETSPSAARAVAGARVVIYNGIDYDPWMEKLLAASPRKDRAVIMVAGLIGKRPGDNPHIWYQPDAMLALARALAKALASADPAHQSGYEQRLHAFEQSMQPIQDRITALRARLAGTPVTATEPVFGYVFQALGMPVRNLAFQRAVMNNTEPGPADIAAFEHDLKSGLVKLLAFNRQVSDPLAGRMRRIAEASHVPVIGVTETEPAGTTYQAWILSELNAVDRALHN